MHNAGIKLGGYSKNQQQIIFHLQFSPVRLVYSVGQFNCSLIIRNFFLVTFIQLDSFLYQVNLLEKFEALLHNKGICAISGGRKYVQHFFSIVLQFQVDRFALKILVQL